MSSPSATSDLSSNSSVSPGRVREALDGLRLSNGNKAPGHVTLVEVAACDDTTPPSSRFAYAYGHLKHVCFVVLIWLSYNYVYSIDTELHVMLFLCVFLVVMTIATERSEYVKENRAAVGTVSWLCYAKRQTTDHNSWSWRTWLAIASAVLLVLFAGYRITGPTVVVYNSPPTPPTPGPSPDEMPGQPQSPLHQHAMELPVFQSRRRRTLNANYNVALVCKEEIVTTTSINMVVGRIDLSRLEDCMHDSMSHTTLEDRLHHIIWSASKIPVSSESDAMYKDAWRDMQITAAIAAANPDRDGVLRAYVESQLTPNGPLVSDLWMTRSVFDAISDGRDDDHTDKVVMEFSRELRARVDEIDRRMRLKGIMDKVMNGMSAFAGWYAFSKILKYVSGPAGAVAVEGAASVMDVADAISKL